VSFYFQTYIHSPIDGAVALIIFLNKEAPTVISITTKGGMGELNKTQTKQWSKKEQAQRHYI